jgi:regulator of replication initiation timing
MTDQPSDNDEGPVILTDDEMRKLVGPIERKWADMVTTNTHLRAEVDSLRLSLELMTHDRNTWEDKAANFEKQRNEAELQRQFMLDQWVKLYALAEETKTAVQSGRISRATPLKLVQKATP